VSSEAIAARAGQVEGFRGGEGRGQAVQAPLAGQRDRGRLGQVGVGGPGDGSVLRGDERARLEGVAMSISPLAA
jgi:hypothetical protein